MLKVAVTGNIGSGKSTVSKIFRSIGVPVFIADIEARLLYNEAEVKDEVRKQIGVRVFTEEDEIDTKALAEVIFKDREALKKINNIIHPRTLKKYHDWLEAHSEYAYTLHESAILFENKLQHHFDKTITISAPPEIRADRVINRDSVSMEEVKIRMENQLSEEEKNKLADFVIINDGSSLLIPQVLEIDKKLKSIK